MRNHTCNSSCPIIPSPITAVAKEFFFLFFCFLLLVNIKHWAVSRDGIMWHLLCGQDGAAKKTQDKIVLVKVKPCCLPDTTVLTAASWQDLLQQAAPLPVVYCHCCVCCSHHCFCFVSPLPIAMPTALPARRVTHNTHLHIYFSTCRVQTHRGVYQQIRGQTICATPYLFVVLSCC